MKKIIDYIVVTAPDADVIRATVKENLKIGWTLHGETQMAMVYDHNLSGVVLLFSQALVKYEGG